MEKLGRSRNRVVVQTSPPPMFPLLKLVPCFSNGDVEVAVSHIQMMELYLCNIYRPPSATLAHFTEALEFIEATFSVATNSNANVLLLGDLNFPKPNIDWEMHDGIVIPVYNQELQSQEHLAFGKLMNLVNKYNMSQVVHNPTRLETTLDLVFTNDPDSILDVIVSPVPSSISDHKFVNTTPHAPPPPPAPLHCLPLLTFLMLTKTNWQRNYARLIGTLSSLKRCRLPKSSMLSPRLLSMLPSKQVSREETRLRLLRGDQS
jgi:hypothetical protein